MKEGDRYYTFSLYSLDKHSVENTNPFIITEGTYHEGEYGKEALEDLHMLFETPNDALKAAKTLYYRRQFESMGRQYDARGKNNWTPFYDIDTKHIEVFNDSYPCPGGVYFDTEEEAKRAIKCFDPHIFCHYVMGLYNATVFVETEM